MEETLGIRKGCTLMNSYTFRALASLAISLAMGTLLITLAAAKVIAQCAPLVSDLRIPLGITQSDQGNLFVSESGTRVPNTGRISIVDQEGNRRTFFDGLPSGINDVNEVSGPAGLFLRDHSLYVSIGIGDTIQAGPAPGTTVPNPNPPSSPIFSSVIAITFSNFVERNTAGFTLTPDDQRTLARGERVSKSNGGADRISIKLIANFPDFFPEPLLAVPNNVRGSNPFDLTLAEGHEDGDRDHFKKHEGDDSSLYVTDGGRNLVWQIKIRTGAFSILAVFPQVANPMFPTLGPPFIDAVPTGIAQTRGQLLVTLFRGAPFPPGTSVVAQVDLRTGDATSLTSGLKAAIDVLPIRSYRDTDSLVLQHASAGPFFGSPGLLLRFETPAGPPEVITNCLTRPTSMVYDRDNGTVYIAEVTPVPPGQPLMSGRIVVVSFAP
jgi:hypothetical protein